MGETEGSVCVCVGAQTGGGQQVGQATGTRSKRGGGGGSPTALKADDDAQPCVKEYVYFQLWYD